MSTLLFAMQLREKVWSMSIAQWSRFHFTDYFTLLRTLLSGSINEVDISTPKAFILPLIYILLYKQVLEQAFLDLEKTQCLQCSKLWKQQKTLDYGIPYTKICSPGLTSVRPPMWQAEAVKELTLSASPAKAVGEQTLTLANRRYSMVSQKLSHK